MSSNCVGSQLEEPSTLVFFVNGKRVSCFNADPKCTLLVYLREHLKLTGTKLGCGEGGCGACTVMISRMEYQTNKIVHYSANACIIPLCSLHGQSVTTVEGIGSTRSRLHSVQERLAKSSGSQCGFCTPGIVMSMYALLRNSPEPNLEDIEVAFQGNLCRCTGYRPILEGYSTFTKEYKCSMGDKCCRNSVSNGCDLNTSTELFQKSEFTPYDCTQEPIFPPELHVSDSLDKQFLFFHKQNIKWYRPTNLSQLLTLKSKYPEAKLIVGNTEIGIEMNIKNFNYPVLIDPSKVIELTQVEEDADGITFGAAVRLTKINDILKEKIRHEPESKTRFFKCASDMFHYFAGKQVRNFASLGGNIMTASPISDMNPIFLANNVELSVASSIDGRVSLKKINMGKGFFTSYRKIIIQPHEVLLSVRFPRTKENQFVKSFKQARRRDDDIAIVNAAISVTFMGKTNVIEKVNLAFGGVAPITVLAPKTTSAMANKKWDKTLVNAVTKSLSEELTLTDNAPGGMIAYRRSLIISLFYKLYLSISKDLPKAGITNTYLSTDEKSGADVFHTLPLKSAQIFEKVSSSQPSSDPIGKPIVHVSGLKQTTGEAMYCDDVPRMENELYLAFVYSSKAHAEIISIDATVALNLAGVHAFFSSKDLTEEQNSVGPIFHDEQLFATKATCHGQVIGAIAADTQSIAKEAARLVKVEYKELTPLIVTIEDAIEKQSFFDGYPQTIAYGDTEEAFKKADHLISGTCRMGGQEHFYLETQAALAMPRDNDEIEIISSTQHPSEIQRLTAHVLSLPASHIVCRVKRLGGGFGGKESRGYPTAVSVALAAYKLQRPVRMMLSRNEDMMITGTRHPFLFKYKASCTKDGRLTGYEAECYCNAGCSMDLSFSVLDRAMRHIENCYNIPNVKVSGWLCKTNLPSNTAFRGFGGPQGMFCAENVIRHVAEVTNKPVDEIMELNLYKDGDRTFYKQLLEFCPIRRCFQECIEQANYHQECDLIKQFNSQNRWRKRGIAIVPTKYGIAFGVPHLNQAGALLNIYLDGSVLLSHGGVEIGQGLHTKMIQVASRALEIPPDLIHIAETATDKVPNTSATAASVGSDINGMAVIKACEVLNSRLKPIKERYPELSWKDRINKAYLDCVSLSATGFYKTPDLDKKTYNYFTTGVGISVVEVDCLTGDHQILKTDIVMDIGSSLNPAIDIGQIEGAFTQGYGLFVLEEMVYSPTGVVYSTGPGMYKLPGFADIPGTFNVTLLTGAPNPRAVYSSKAVGEPPLFIGSSVFFAIKDAISAAREQNGYSKYFQLTSPATAARIRMACEDQFTEAVHKPDEGFVGWNVMP